MIVGVTTDGRYETLRIASVCIADPGARRSTDPPTGGEAMADTTAHTAGPGEGSARRLRAELQAAGVAVKAFVG